MPVFPLCCFDSAVQRIRLPAALLENVFEIWLMPGLEFPCDIFRCVSGVVINNKDFTFVPVERAFR